MDCGYPCSNGRPCGLRAPCGVHTEAFKEEKERQFRGIELIASEVCRKLVPRRDQSHAALRASLECSRRAAAHARHTLRRALSAVSAHRGRGAAAAGWRRTWGTASRASVFR